MNFQLEMAEVQEWVEYFKTHGSSISMARTHKLDTLIRNGVPNAFRGIFNFQLEPLPCRPSVAPPFGRVCILANEEERLLRDTARDNGERECQL